MTQNKDKRLTLIELLTWVPITVGSCLLVFGVQSLGESRNGKRTELKEFEEKQERDKERHGSGWMEPTWASPVLPKVGDTVPWQLEGLKQYSGWERH